MPHFILPIEYHEDAKKPAFIKRMMSFTQGKPILEMQVSEVLERKSHFVAESEEFQRKCRGFHEEVEASFDTLHQSLYDCLISGIEEAKAHIKEPEPSLANPVAREFWQPQGNFTLLNEISDISGVFKAMEEQLNDAKAVLEVKCPNLLEEFKADHFKLLRESSEAQEYRRNQEEKAADTGIQYSTKAINTEENRVYEFLCRLMKFVCKLMKKLKAKSSCAQIGLTILIIMIAFPVCLMGCSAMKDADIVYRNSTSRDKLMQLGAYNGGKLVTLLLATGPVQLKTGYYKGQWDTKESHISGYGTMAYHSGDIYEGYWKEGQRHGSGRLITAQGDVYEGMWFEGEFSGWGICTLSSGTTIQGYWKRQKLQGFAQIIEGNSTSMGEFEGNKRSGLGLHFVSISNFSLGIWRNGEMHGSGFDFLEGEIMWGNYEYGKLQGNATYIDKFGVKYTGEWVKDVKNGIGVETYPAEYYIGLFNQGSPSSGTYHYNGTFRVQYEENNNAYSILSMRYDEPWLLGLSLPNNEGYYQGQINNNYSRHGVGIQFYQDNSYYIGHWMNDQWNGQGCLQTAQGDIYEGMWVNGEFSGWGNCTLSTGVTKFGHWQGWKLHGFGRIIEGISLVMGEFVGGKMSGFGLQYRSIYNFTLGMWHNETLHGLAFQSQNEGIIIGNYDLGQLCGNITFIEASGVRYVGEWERGMKKGKGVESYPAEFLAGQWTQGILSQGEYHYLDSYRLMYELKENIISEIRKELADAWLIAMSKNNTEGHYQGQFSSKYLRHGYGRQRYHTRLSYTGMWANDKRDGQGREVTAQGEVCEGVWKGMELTGWGNCYFSDGLKKSGQWKAGKMEGIGHTLKQNTESFGTFKNGLLRGIGMQYGNASAYSVGNWSNGKLGGPGIEYNDGVIRLRDSATSPAHELWVNDTSEVCVRRKSSVDYPWTISDNGIQVEAITFYTSESVFLTAVGIGNVRSWTSELQTLQILHGPSTSGALVYNHSTQPTLHYSSYKPFTKISLEQHVFIQADNYYTLRLKYSAGSEVYYCINEDNDWTAEGGLYFTFSKAEFSAQEAGNDSLKSGPIRDFYFVTQA